MTKKKKTLWGFDYYVGWRAVSPVRKYYQTDYNPEMYYSRCGNYMGLSKEGDNYVLKEDHLYASFDSKEEAMLAHKECSDMLALLNYFAIEKIDELENKPFTKLPDKKFLRILKRHFQ